MNKRTISRREMLKLSGSLIAGTVLSGCVSKTPEAQPPTAPPQPATQAPVAAKPTIAAPTVISPTKGPQGNVVVFHDVKELTEDMIAQFQNENPGITIEFVNREEPARLSAMIAAGTPPDLIRVQAPTIPGYLARGLLMDLTPYFEASSVLHLDDLMPANDYYKAESPMKIGSGKIYGMCKDFSPDFTLFAYKKAFEDAGVPLPDATKALTYAEIAELAQKTAKKEGDRVLMWGYGYEDGWIDRIWMNALAELGQNLYSDDFSKVIIGDNEDTRKIAQYYFDLAKDNLTVNPVNPSPSGWAGGDFTAGTLAMMQYGFWYSAMAETDTTKGQVVMLPGATWTGKRRDPTMTATGMVMAAASKNPDAAWVVFEWFNGGKPATDRASSGWGVPALKSMLNMVPQETDFQKQCFQILQGELALETPPLQFNPYLGETEFTNSWKTHLEGALRGNITFDQMVKNIEGDINTAIADNKAIIGG
jgi:multiple sugar transport system substrate-binding protein